MQKQGFGPVWVSGLVVVAAVLTASAFVSGCGAITAAAVVKQGAMWAGKELIKKEYEEYKAKKRAKKEEEARQQAEAAAWQREAAARQRGVEMRRRQGEAQRRAVETRPHAAPARPRAVPASELGPASGAGLP